MHFDKFCSKNEQLWSSSTRFTIILSLDIFTKKVQHVEVPRHIYNKGERSEAPRCVLQQNRGASRSVSICFAIKMNKFTPRHALLSS